MSFTIEQDVCATLKLKEALSQRTWTPFNRELLNRTGLRSTTIVAFKRYRDTNNLLRNGSGSETVENFMQIHCKLIIIQESNVDLWLHCVAQCTDYKRARAREKEKERKSGEKEGEGELSIVRD